MKNRFYWLAALAIAPFVVGFTPPEEPGLHVNGSLGTGRFVSASGCSHPRMHEYSEQQAGAYYKHDMGDAWGTRLGAGVDAQRVNIREATCLENDCANAGWGADTAHWSFGGLLTADWRWVGLGIGALGNPLPDQAAYRDLPRGHLRVGPMDRIYGTFDLASGGALLSEGLFAFGLGGRLGRTDLWLGASAPPVNQASVGLGLKVAQPFGPVRVTLGGRLGQSRASYTETDQAGRETDKVEVSVPEYAMHVGLDYRLPF